MLVSFKILGTMHLYQFKLLLSRIGYTWYYINLLNSRTIPYNVYLIENFTFNK